MINDLEGYDKNIRFGVIFPNFNSFVIQMNPFTYKTNENLEQEFLKIQARYNNDFFKHTNINNIFQQLSPYIDRIQNAKDILSVIDNTSNLDELNKTLSSNYTTDNTLELPDNLEKEKFLSNGTVEITNSKMEVLDFLNKREDWITKINNIITEMNNLFKAYQIELNEIYQPLAINFSGYTISEIVLEDNLRIDALERNPNISTNEVKNKDTTFEASFQSEINIFLNDRIIDVENSNNAIFLSGEKVSETNILDGDGTVVSRTFLLNTIQDNIDLGQATLEISKAYVDAADLNLQTQIDNIAPENYATLDNLNTEKDERIASDSNIQSQINLLPTFTYVDTRDNAIQSNLNLEVYKQSVINDNKADKTYVDSQDNLLQLQIDNIDLSGDYALVSDLENEANLRLTTDTSLQSQITNEIKNRKDADKLLSTIEYTNERDTILQENINSLGHELTQETTLRTQGDLYLQGQINDLSIGSGFVTQGQLDQERLQRIQNDEVLGVRIDDKTSYNYVDNEISRQDNDIALKADKSYVNSENDAQDILIDLKADLTYVDIQDTNLQNQINDITIGTGFATTEDLNLEITNRTNADTSLQNQVNTKVDQTYVDNANDTQDTKINTKADKTYVDSSDANLQSQINLIDTSNYATLANLTTEEEARIAGDALLQTQLDNLDLSGDYATSQELAQEVSARIQGDLDLGIRIDNISTDNFATLEDLNLETTNRINADTTLQGNIDLKADITYVDTQDILLQNQINLIDTSTYATKNELALEQTARSEEDTILSNQISLKADKTELANYGTIAYIDNANQAQDLVIAGKATIGYVDSENNAQDTIINSKADKTYVDSQDILIEGLISQEQIDRAAADTILQDQIDLLQVGGDYASNTDLTNEVNARIAGDNALDLRIDGIVTGTGFATVEYVDNADNLEITNRINGDATLQAQIDLLQGGFIQKNLVQTYRYTGGSTAFTTFDTPNALGNYLLEFENNTGNLSRIMIKFAGENWIGDLSSNSGGTNPYHYIVPHSGTNVTFYFRSFSDIDFQIYPSIFVTETINLYEIK